MIGWIKALGKTSGVAMLGLMPAWAWYGLIALSLVMFGGWINGQRWELKYNAHISADSTRVEQAKTAQSNDNTVAATQYVIVEGKEKIKYVERTAKAKDYEKRNQSDAPRTCRANDWVGDEFERMYNGEPTALPKTAN